MSARNPILATEAPVFVDGAMPSTMDAARWRAINGDVSGTLVVACEQTGGRGRYGNRWASPPGGLYLSLIVRPAEGEASAHWRDQTVPWLALRAALALHQAVAPMLPTEHSSPFGIKWPNDLYLGGKKLSGVLVETGVAARRQPFAIVGLGLNVHTAPADLPAHATSLKIAGADPAPGLPGILALPALARMWRAHFFAAPPPGAPLRAALEERLLGRGEPVTIGWRAEEQTSADKRKTVSGRLAGLGARAEAILEDTHGKRLSVSEGHLVKWSTWTT